MPNRIKFVLGLLAGLALFSFTLAFARAQEVIRAQTLVCDTTEQIEQFLVLHNKNVPTMEVLEQVNGDKQPPACGIVPVAFYRGKMVVTTFARGRVVEITKILVVGAFDGLRWFDTTPVEQYTIFISKEKGA